MQRDVRNIVNSPKYILPFLQPGRLICVAYSQNPTQSESLARMQLFEKGEVPADQGGEETSVWGAVVNFEKYECSANNEGQHGEDRQDNDDVRYVVDILVNCRESPKARSRNKGERNA